MLTYCLILSVNVTHIPSMRSSFCGSVNACSTEPLAVLGASMVVTSKSICSATSTMKLMNSIFCPFGPLLDTDALMHVVVL